uniref:CLIP domain-containing serine protease n=1 Tax=Timema bartmani TaxID=61472 RepID=A0A7R9I2W1_9NEOP|nr:unnamed protein product [Timema bartmani]
MLPVGDVEERVAGSQRMPDTKRTLALVAVCLASHLTLSQAQPQGNTAYQFVSHVLGISKSYTTVLVSCPNIFSLVNAHACTDIRFQSRPSCLTPDNKNGRCINIKQCPELLSLLRSNRQQPGVAQFLRGSACGYDGFDPKVCCIDTTSRVEEGGGGTTPPPAPLPIVKGGALPQYPQCGFSNISSQRIVGGYPSKLGAFPWLAALGYTRPATSTKKGPKFLCGAALVTTRHVITAGHCVYSRDDLYMVRLGEHNLESDEDGASPIDVPIAKNKIHEEYSPTTFSNDIAILWLKESVQTTLMIRPICLPTAPELRSMSFVRNYPFIAGWGAINFNGPSSTALLQLQVPVVEQDSCKSAYENFHTTIIDDRVLCAGFAKGGKDACQGDSGGPLMWPKGGTEFYLIGIVSYGYRCAEPGYPGVYTRITAFIDWITKNID